MKGVRKLFPLPPPVLGSRSPLRGKTYKQPQTSHPTPPRRSLVGRQYPLAQTSTRPHWNVVNLDDIDDRSLVYEGDRVMRAFRESDEWLLAEMEDEIEALQERLRMANDELQSVETEQDAKQSDVPRLMPQNVQGDAQVNICYNPAFAPLPAKDPYKKVRASMQERQDEALLAYRGLKSDN